MSLMYSAVIVLISLSLSQVKRSDLYRIKTCTELLHFEWKQSSYPIVISKYDMFRKQNS